MLLPRLRAPRGGRGRRQLEAGAWPGAAGRGLLGRLLATGRGIAGRSRPRRPGGSGAEGSRRSSPAEPWDLRSSARGQRPWSGGEGAAGPGGTARIAPPRAGPGRRARCPLQAAVGGVVSRAPLAPRDSGLQGPAPSRCSPAAGTADRSLPRASSGKGPFAVVWAAALGGIAEALGSCVESGLRSPGGR